MRFVLERCLAVVVLSFLPTSSHEKARPAVEGEGTVRVFVEFELPASAVAEHRANGVRRAFDRPAHEAAIREVQDGFLRSLEAEGIAFQVTETPLQLPAGAWSKPNRFSFLINGMELALPASAVARLRTREGVKRVTPDESF